MLEFSHSLQGGPGSPLEAFNQVVQEWNVSCQEAHPDWQVEINVAGTTYADPVKALELPREQRPTFVLLPEYLKSKMEAATQDGTALPIDTLIKPETIGDINQIVRETFGSKNGRLECLPFNPSCAGMFANQDVLKAIGKAPDYSPASREELEEVAQLIFANKDMLVKEGLLAPDFGIYTCAWPAAYLVEIPLTQQGQPLIEPTNGRLGPGRYVLKTAFPLFLQLREDVRNGVFIYGGQQLGSRELFLEKKAVFYMQGLGHGPILKSLKPTFPIQAGVVPTPKGLQGRVQAVPIGGASVWVLDSNKTQRMIEGVRAFLDYLSSREIMKKWHIDTGCVPVLKSTQAELKETKIYDKHPLHRAVIAQTVEAEPGENSFGFHTPNWADARKDIFAIIERVIEREGDGSFKLTDAQVGELLAAFDHKFNS
ncbi:MAG: extracellular solute-binding protein [Rhabdochlamydiaceae bacterium]|jgi:ABC-type glycerol-3-phosphate transport system substrate-binding protein